MYPPARIRFLFPILLVGCLGMPEEDVSDAFGPVLADDDTPQLHMCGEDKLDVQKLEGQLITKAEADNPHGLAVQVLTPYATTTETHPDWGPPGHWTPWLGDWAADLWQDNGGSGLGNSCGDSIYLKVRAVQAPGGQVAEEVRARVVAQGYACASGNYIEGGYMQKYAIEARYGATWYDLGWVLIAHLDNMSRSVGDVFDPANAYLGTAFQGGITGPCWGSCHVHIELDNTRGTSCYDLLPPTTGIASDDGIGAVGGNLSGGDCPTLTEPSGGGDCGGSCPYSSIQTRVQKDTSVPWVQSTTIALGESFHLATFQNGWGVFTEECTNIEIIRPDGTKVSAANDSYYTPQSVGTYQVVGQCGSLSETATVTVLSQQVMTGSVTVGQADSNSWKSVTFAQSMTSTPVVVMSPVSYNGNQPTTVRVRNVSSTGFEFQLDEWNYLDGSHTSETLFYVAATPGVHDWSGMQVVAGQLSVDEKLVSASFPASFSTTPVVLAQVSSRTGSSAVAVRLRNISTTGFETRLWEEEAANNAHSYETVDYIALEPGDGWMGNYLVRAAITPLAVTQNWYSIDFQGVLNSTPLFFAHMQTEAGTDTSVLRYDALTTTDVQVKVEEEQSLDTEVYHTTESVGWVVFSYIP